MNTIGIIALLALFLLVTVLGKGRKWDQWHHGWLLLVALDLPPWVRITCLVIGCDDLLQHVLERLFGWKNASPIKQLYYWYEVWTTD